MSGKYYLVDAGYKNKPGFLAPFLGQTIIYMIVREKMVTVGKKCFTTDMHPFVMSSREHLECGKIDFAF